MANTLKFGGKKMILAGDFQQLPPVVQCKRTETRSATVAASISSSLLFREFHVLTLTENCRFLSHEYYAYLTDIARGNCPYEDQLEGIQSVPLFTNMKRVYDTEEAVREFQQEFEALTPRLMLAPRHDAVNSFNEKQLARFRERGLTRTYPAHQEVRAPGVSESLLRIYADDSEHFTPNGVAPHALEIFVGCPVMLLRNMFPSKGYSNGTIMTVVSMENHHIEVRTSSGLWKDRLLKLPRINFAYKAGPVDVLRKQFPIVPAFAATINKVQGQTLHCGIIDLRQPVFGHGQLFVGLSRFIDCKRVVVILPKEEGELKSVVYKEILRNAKLI
jgi:ATP-dependent DNA helicase PIF1